jgi:hypothetical protein
VGGVGGAGQAELAGVDGAITVAPQLGTELTRDIVVQVALGHRSSDSHKGESSVDERLVGLVVG